MTKKYEILQEKYIASVASDNESDMSKIGEEIAEIQRKTLFRALVRNLKLNSWHNNIFKYASEYARSVVSNELTPDSTHYEISGVDSKCGRPVVVEF